MVRVHFLEERWFWHGVQRCVHWLTHAESCHGDSLGVDVAGHRISPHFWAWWWCPDAISYRKHQRCHGRQQRCLHHDQGSGFKLPSEGDLLEISPVESQIVKFSQQRKMEIGAIALKNPSAFDGFFYMDGTDSHRFFFKERLTLW